MNATILLVEDNLSIIEINREALRAEGFAVLTATTIAEAQKKINTHKIDLIILDGLLPDGNGFSLCEQLRGANNNVPILFLTALDTSKDIVAGFGAGGDDYLPKPYDMAVLIMRVKSLLKRARSMPETLSYGPIRVNVSSGKTFVNGEELVLPQKELYLLIQFMRKPEHPFPAKQLYKMVWGQEMLGRDNAIKVAVSKLRAKLQGTGCTISALRGEGYYLERE
jgi:DNA-binding response OmpR family regulator